ncbi:unnamed protein product [Vitrella brassicaformis CCMP3155]|uniref:Photosystem II reaction center M protein n=1 Tax=Vitrella brassicaformis (strain CCMP3155) TaxID=1169540 RepID=A0A0G4EAE0_VITBC|nr:unnamed protein product [Vitrella brassicaformis CCMP3155]|mmetsp:Transcript_17390/g.49331  ORF Transcript_17390/g.49331 Transcript_17390/m.49331 type:complete len:123 (-) Transcript_17390:1586-1954(-)|eukprot:CEL92440.1 unnamed protein product [Vitrella brassicaformis CCMP3155]
MLRAVVLCALVAAVSCFSFQNQDAAFVGPNPAALRARSGRSGLTERRALEGLAAAPMLAPALANADTGMLDELSTQLNALEVTEGGFYATILGTLLPILFLVVVYAQSEARKSAERRAGIEE